jgi:hypothetical protein
VDAANTQRISAYDQKKGASEKTFPLEQILTSLDYRFASSRSRREV